MNHRETAWRAFSTELSTAVHEIKGDDEKSPNYQLSRLGAMMNRAIVAGTLTETENMGTEDEPNWRGRLQDPVGTVYLNVGRFQSEASDIISGLDVPCYVVAIGKVRSYAGDDGRVFVSLRPESILKVDKGIRDQWVLDAAQSTWRRLKNMKMALQMESVSEQALMEKGATRVEAKGIQMALEHYGVPQSSDYLSLIQAALRDLLPNKEVDFGLPSNVGDDIDEIDIDPIDDGSIDGMESIVLALLERLDIDGKGAPIDELQRCAEDEGISATELDQVCNNLMDKAMVYEPSIKYLKRI